MEKNKYVDYIISKLDTINDKKLKDSINKLIEEKEYLLNSIEIDSLTEVYNRKVLDSVKEYDVVVMCDIDNFKNINDMYGHNIGDEVLKIVARRLFASTRIDDIVCRYGGDEFLIIFKNCDIDVAYKRMQDVQNHIKHPLRKSDLSISISVGISKKEKNKTLQDIINEADDALYYSKRNGKNQISIYSKEK